ncbi:putative muscular protein-like protein [Dinothrombium tinctorium]|uniref:Putative muscular protein-like protein n=1 Tax=Dinothrombium tinctorium TaxID=1965070 RepID=A0A3S3PCC8_9ACAR|nr:putative muscular protein-like protein [Dinothrombium tinctorium]
MAGLSYGMSKFVEAKMLGKRDKNVENAILQWIGAVIEEKIPEGEIEQVLKDGVILCKLINKLIPGFVAKINTSGGDYKMMENINKFLEGAKKYGVAQTDLFQTVDLYERRNIPVVTDCLLALGRQTQKHPEYKGPSFE